jgi:UDP-glucose 4-epimerase
VVRGDLSCAETVDQLVSQLDFEGICHLAGLTSIRDSLNRPTMYFDVNMGIAVNILKAVRSRYERTGRPTRMVFASTRAVYARAKDELVAETYPAAPASPYGVTKRAVEQLMEFESSSGIIGAVVLRLFNVSGADRGIVDRQPRLIPNLIGAIRGTLPPVPLNSLRYRRDFVHVLDAGRAFVTALDGCQPGQYRVYNVGSGEGTSVERVLRLLEEVSGRPVPHRPAPEELFTVGNAEDPDAGIADISLIQRELRWEPQRSIEKLVSDAWRFSDMVGDEERLEALGNTKGDGLR